MPDYNQRPKSQDGIHQLEILQYIKFWFLDVVFVRLSRTSVRWLWHPTKHAYSSWNDKSALFDTKVIIPGLFM